MMRTILILLTVLATACGGAAGNRGGAPAEDSANTLTGVLGGDAQLEGGCAWLDVDGERYEVFYPEGYTVEFEPVRLMGPDGEVVAGEGDEVTITGEVTTDRMSICQVGQIVEATAVQA
jgi:hypothetical protein